MPSLKLQFIVPIALHLLLPAVGNSRAYAQGLEYVKANYTKYEYRIPMRDGKRLFTAVYVPKDDSQRWPILLTRTPYSVGPYGADQYKSDLGPSPLLGKEGYIVAYQDVRGRWMSEGEFVNVRPYKPVKSGPADIDESSDTWDTIEWLTRHVPNHNGKVGMWGISYPGFYTTAGLIDAHPALKAASPQAPVSDWFVGDDFHHNGALFLADLFNFMSNFGRPRPEPVKKQPPQFEHGTPDGYEFFLRLGTLADANKRYFQNQVAFWDDCMRHGAYDDFWKARNVRQHLKNIRPAVMTVGGWFDAEDLFGPLETYKQIERSSPDAANMLVVGPWRHGGWNNDDGSKFGDVSFNSKVSGHYREKIELPFFEFHLKGKGDYKPPEAWVFETGVNQWRRHERWPPAESQGKAFYFHGDGKLSPEPPAESDSAFDEYLSDPQRPVPFVGDTTIGVPAEYMLADQRFAARRPDVLTYQTDVLDEDTTIAGPIRAELQVSTSGTDSDWIVKLIDVYPNDYPDPNPNPKGVRMGGYQQLVRAEVMRGKFRNSLESPEPFKPDEPTAVHFTLQDAYHTFRSGHRIMLQVQSSWFPLVDRNPQKFIDIYHAQPRDFQRATQRLYRSGKLASRIVLPLLERP